MPRGESPNQLSLYRKPCHKIVFRTMNFIMLQKAWPLAVDMVASPAISLRQNDCTLERWVGQERTFQKHTQCWQLCVLKNRRVFLCFQILWKPTKLAGNCVLFQKEPCFVSERMLAEKKITYFGDNQDNCQFCWVSETRNNGWITGWLKISVGNFSISWIPK